MMIMANLSISAFTEVVFNRYKQHLIDIYMKTTNYLLKFSILILLAILFILSYPTRFFSNVILPVFRSTFGGRVSGKD